jgi:Gly-Xaa carboxypeptidase
MRSNNPTNSVPARGGKKGKKLILTHPLHYLSTDQQSNFITLIVHSNRSLPLFAFIMNLRNIIALSLSPLLWAAVAHDLSSYEWRHQCPQLKPLFPKSLDPRNLTDDSRLDDYFKSEGFLNTSVDRLSGAVKIDTTSQSWWQDLPGKDPAWKPMIKFREYLTKAFPLIHEKLKLETVNKNGLVYTWEGANPSLKPTLLLAHQDVVPVSDDTIDEWKYPPFSGFFDGKHVWGRGAFDCKTTLIGSMSAVESLLMFGWTPQRTLILAFGFDEEISGFQGAKRISEHLEMRYGKDGIALLMDEGPGIFHYRGSTLAVPALSEKGTLDVNISVHMTSGHSSASYGYNSIIAMSALIEKIRSNQLPNKIQVDDLLLQAIFCLGQHVPGLDGDVIPIIKDIDRDEKAISNFIPWFTKMESLKLLRPLTGNTEALSIIRGGDKINIIPDRTTLSINYRLQLGTSVEQAKNHLERLVKDYITNLSTVEDGANLTFRGWSELETVHSIKLTALPGEREPSPITSFSVDGTNPYSVLHRTIRSVYDDKNLTLVAPISLPANTDSRHYWNLTQHIFRFSPGHDMADPDDQSLGSRIHSTNERANILGHINGVRWYSLFIQNMDEAEMA